MAITTLKSYEQQCLPERKEYHVLIKVHYAIRSEYVVPET
jgi:hypothetical protein